MPIKMEAVPELPEIKSEIKAEDFISASSTASNQSPHQQSHTPNLVEQIQNFDAIGIQMIVNISCDVVFP